MNISDLCNLTCKGKQLWLMGVRFMHQRSWVTNTISTSAVLSRYGSHEQRKFVKLKCKLYHTCKVFLWIKRDDVRCFVSELELRFESAFDQT